MVEPIELNGPADADARLIAAAPKLAEALRDLLASVDRYGATDALWSKRAERARAALRKAGY